MTVTRALPGRNASPRTARAINDRLALRLLQEEGPLTAGQLKELTGMSRPSVADLVERLQEAGLIEVVGEAGEARRGPNARVYGIVAHRAYVAGLDVRIESIGVEIADLLGRTVAHAVMPVAPDAPPERIVEDGIALLTDTARAAGATAGLHTVAFGAPGLVAPVTGRLSSSGALPAWHGDLVDEVRKRLGVPVLLENEVNLAAVAEQRNRPAGESDTFVLLWIGGGVGAGVVLDGRLRRGISGGAGEVGFLPISGSGRLPTATDCDNGYHGWVGSRAVCA
ncbi:MarR family protein, partial [Streptomyces sp. DvalAA-14]|uniref:ROK family transcriptional regulator n=1 Tax=unclassified Streptomyces TaxID=2593676 RepID=UPI00081B6AEB